ncbi:MAG: type II secretion system protein GspG [Pontiellaceae bacterium]|nr:type II secretion system protein GspG [Pontiellaceae bacterium]
MKHKKLLTALLVVWTTRSVFANPILVFPNLYGISETIAPLFVAPTALLIEYIAVRFFLRKWMPLRRVLPVFFLVNLITFPITQILGSFLVWFAEIFPLTVEPILYRKHLKKKRIEVPGLTRKIVTANLISFIVGIALVALFEIFPSRTPHRNKAKIVATKANLITLEIAIDEYKMNTGNYPDPEMGLISLIEYPGVENWSGPYLQKKVLPKDGWGNDFIYRLENGVPTIRSAGPDGKVGTKDDIVSDYEFQSSDPEEEGEQSAEPDSNGS